MINKIRIKNIFRNLPTMDGIILACDVVGKISDRDLMIISDNTELLISEVEQNIEYNEVNILLSEKNLNGFKFNHSLIGKEFLIKKGSVPDGLDML